MQSSAGFQSYFKINNVPIMPPVITDELRLEILKIRELVRAKEQKYQKQKEEKDRENIAKQSELDEEDGVNRSRRNSYTLSSPTFSSYMLPKISTESSESDKETVVDGFTSLQSTDMDLDESKSSKDLKNEIDKLSTTASSIYESVIQPQVNNQLKELIEKQKQEYLNAMDELKNKFSNEQQQLLFSLSTLQISSTPLNCSEMVEAATDDEEFAEFKTCLQSRSISIEEKTIVDDHDAKAKAATKINAYARGFLTRRLMKTIYVQEHVRNIKETLQLVLNLDDHDMGGQNVLMRLKLFRQLQSDLHNFNEIFFQYSMKERMKIIASDRDIRSKKLVDENKADLSLSFQDFIG